MNLNGCLGCEAGLGRTHERAGTVSIKTVPDTRLGPDNDDRFGAFGLADAAAEQTAYNLTHA